MAYQYWNEKDLQKLRSIFPHYSNVELAELFPGRTILAIKQIGSKLGLRKSEETLQRIKPVCMSKAYEARRKGWSINKDGYVLIYMPDHPFAGSNGCVMEHRLTMETQIGRYLEPNEVVHHIDRNKRNNSIENLQLMSLSEHISLHSTGKVVSPETIAKWKETHHQRYKKENHYTYKSISEQQLKDAVTTSKSLAVACEKLNIGYNCFYDKLNDLNLREWYKRAKQIYFNRALNKIS